MTECQRHEYCVLDALGGDDGGDGVPGDAGGGKDD